MRIAVVNWSARKVAGTEAHLDVIMSELPRAGHQVALLSEFDVPADRPRIGVPSGSPSWCASRIGFGPALDALRAWRPDLIYTHGAIREELEAQLVEVAPAVFFAHAYYGTCISGEKTHKWPAPIPCHRRFGWPCLLHYYPRRCGGLNPLTMLREYSRQRRRHRLLHRYRMVVTASAYVRDEYLRHGFSPGAVRQISYPLEPLAGNGASPPAAAARRAARAPASPRCLLFAGRMTNLKGGLIFLEALPAVTAALGEPLRVVFAGDGPQRSRWETKAARLRDSMKNLEVEFTGWLDQPRLEKLYAASDLLVVPSLWPEPFGLVGPEAGLRAVPAAAFAVGGVPEWLVDGVNGCLASGDPPTSAGLAEAIVRCLRDPADYARLRRGAVEMARRFSVRQHMAALVEVFAQAVEGRALSTAAASS